MTRRDRRRHQVRRRAKRELEAERAEVTALLRSALGSARSVHPGRPLREVWLDEQDYARLAAYAWGKA